MSFSVIAYIAPNYRDYKNYWLKAYEPGTTTPKSMATDSTLSVLIAKAEINKDGFIESAGGALIIPYIDGAYDLWLFPTEAEADANDTINAERAADNITGVSNDSVESGLINDLSQSYTFETVALMTSTDLLFPVGKKIFWQGYNSASDGGSNWGIIKSGVHTADGFTIFSIDAGTYVEANIKGKSLNVAKAGAVEGVIDPTAAIQTVLDLAEGKEVRLNKLTYNLTAPLTSPPRTAEYGLQIKGPASGACVLDFDLSGSEIKDGFYLSHRPADPADWDKSAEYTGAVIQRNIQLRGFTVKNTNQLASTPGTRLGSGIQLYFTSMCSVKDVICQGWKRGLDLWCWASSVDVVRARECDVGFYVWTGTTVNISSTYAQSCQTGYLIGGEKNTSVGDNTDTPGVQNPYPPHRPTAIVLSGTACDGSNTYAYYVNDAANVTFDTVSAEGATLGMFRVDKNTGKVLIINPNFTTSAGSFTDSESFLTLGDGFTDITLSSTRYDGVFTNALIRTEATGTQFDGSIVRMDEFRDFSSGAGAGIIEPLSMIRNSLHLTKATATILVPLRNFNYVDEGSSSISFKMAGTYRAGGSGYLVGYDLEVVLAGSVTGSHVVYSKGLDYGVIFESGGFPITSFTVDSITATATDIVIVFNMQNSNGTIAADANRNRASVQQLTSWFE